MKRIEDIPIEEFLSMLKIPKKYIKEQSGVVYDTEFGKAYQMGILNSDAYSKLYLYLTSLKFPELDDEDQLQLDGEYSEFNFDGSVIRFFDGQYEVTLSADFDEDEYTLTIAVDESYDDTRDEDEEETSIDDTEEEIEDVD